MENKNISKLKNYGIILASGNGSRYSTDIPKQFVKIAGKTILEHTIDVFEKAKEVDEYIVHRLLLFVMESVIPLFAMLP